MGKNRRNNRGGNTPANQESAMEEQIDPAMAGQDPNVGGGELEGQEDEVVEKAADVTAVTTEQVGAGQAPADGAKEEAKDEAPVVPAAPVVPESPAPVLEQAAEGVTLAPVAPAPVKEAAPAPVAAPVDSGASGVAAPTLAQAIEKETGVKPGVEVKESLQVASIRFALDDYIKKMAPGVPVTVVQGAAMQARLYNTLMTVINRLADQDFSQSMNIVLEKFNNEAEGVFNPRYVFRFMEHVELTSPRITQFQRLLNMFHLMAPAASRRAAGEHCNWSETLSGEITDAGRNRVLSFFKVG